MADAGAGVAALVLGAGEGARLGRPKAFLEARGVTLVERVVARLAPCAAEVVVGLRAADVERGRDLLGGRAAVVAGGATRQETFDLLLAATRGGLVLLHEVARPFATAQLVARVLAAGREHGAAAPVVPAGDGDSLALADGAWLGDALPRERVVRTQTPQAYRRDVLVEALAAARSRGVDATSVTTIVRLAGHGVRLVPGDPQNAKITFPEDWSRARERLEGEARG